jgi:hypothetical protein
MHRYYFQKRTTSGRILRSNFMFMKFLFFVFLIMCAQLSFAQGGRQMEPIFVQGTAYRNTGWFVAPGATWMMPYDRRQSITEYIPGGEANDTLFSGDYKRGGRLGLYVEAGRHHFTLERILVHHIDYGIHFKMLRGKEAFTGITNAGGTMAPASFDGKFSESFAGAFFNASNIIQVKRNFWIQNSLGVNLDYRILSNRNSSGSPYGADMNYPTDFMGQLHYRIGFGWKPEAGMYIIPMIETPLLTAFPWDGGKSTLPYFAGRFRPIIFTLRIQWLSQAANRRCENQPGTGPDGVSKDDPGKHRHNGLWGPEAKKIKKARKKQKVK